MATVNIQPEFAPLHNASGELAYRPNAPFFLTHFGEDRGNWYVGEVEGVSYWLPHLRLRPIVPGAGVRTRRTDDEPLSETYEGLVNKLRKQGHVVILESNDLRFVTRYRARHPITGEVGWLHCPVWARPKPERRGARNAGVVKYEVDTVARDRFCYNLVADGIIAPLSDRTANEIDERSIARIERRVAEDPDKLGALPPVGSQEFDALDINSLPLALRRLAEVRAVERQAARVPPPQRASAPALPRTNMRRKPEVSDG